jgi:hypothetical protein
VLKCTKAILIGLTLLVKQTKKLTMPIFEWRHRLASQYKMNTDGIMIGRAAIGYPGF